jgi:hypothetical protein
MAGYLTPLPTHRQSSASGADIYGPDVWGGITTASVGSGGTARLQALAADQSQGAPVTVHGIGPEFLQRPAGALLALIALLAIISFVDGSVSFRAGGRVSV